MCMFQACECVACESAYCMFVYVCCIRVCICICCMHRSVCVCVFGCVCASVWRPELTMGVFFTCSLPYCRETRQRIGQTDMEPEADHFSQAGWSASSWNLPSPVPSAGLTGMASMWVLRVGTHVRMLVQQALLSTDPSLQPG